MSTPFIFHVEWGTSDPKTLQGFLSDLFGWEFISLTPEYLMHLPENGGVSIGIMKSETMRAGGSPSASVRVVDLDATLEKAQSLGAQVVVPKTQMGKGAFAFIAAPDGNLIGLQMV
jgi:predicted enzyme related to lactoylglutathione lyase